MKLQPIYRNGNPILEVQRELQIKNELINNLSSEINKVKNYDGLYNSTYGSLMW